MISRVLVGALALTIATVTTGRALGQAALLAKLRAEAETPGDSP